jgi:hypothetical protein
MPTITIDNIEYDTDSMSADALANLQSIQFVDAEIARLQAIIATMNTARLAYGTVLSELLQETVD